MVAVRRSSCRAPRRGRRPRPRRPRRAAARGRAPPARRVRAAARLRAGTGASVAQTVQRSSPAAPGSRSSRQRSATPARCRARRRYRRRPSTSVAGSRERDVGRSPDAVEAVVAERDPVLGRPPPAGASRGRPRIAADLEDVGGVGRRGRAPAESRPRRDRRGSRSGPAPRARRRRSAGRARSRSSVRRASSSGWTFASGFRSALGLVSWMRAAVVAAHRALEQDRPRRRRRAGPSRTGAACRPGRGPRPRESGWMSPNWSVSRKSVAVLEDLDGAEVGRLHDRARRAARRTGRSARLRPASSAARVTVRIEAVGLVGHDQRVDQRVDLALRAPPGRSWTVSPIRWSVTRSCGKL